MKRSVCPGADSWTGRRRSSWHNCAFAASAADRTIPCTDPGARCALWPDPAWRQVLVTMLDRMRRHRSWLKWSLGIVVVTFIILYVPSCSCRAGRPGLPPTRSLRSAGAVTVGTFQRAYTQQASAMRSAYGDQFNEQMLQQLGMDRRILDQLLNDEAVLVEADRLGIRVSDEELRERIITIPAFQENGAVHRLKPVPPVPAACSGRRCGRRVRARNPPAAHPGKTAGAGHRLGER